MCYIFRPIVAIIRSTEPSHSPYLLSTTAYCTGQCFHIGSSLNMYAAQVMPICYEIYCGVFTTCKNCWATETSKHRALRNNRRRGVSSVPCRAAPRLLLRTATINTSRQQRINKQQYITLCFPLVRSWRHTTAARGSRDSCLLLRLTDWLTVSRNVTLTLTLRSLVFSWVFSSDSDEWSWVIEFTNHPKYNLSFSSSVPLYTWQY
jgi:hypothetical protein